MNFQCLDYIGRRRDGFGLIAFALEQEPQRFENVGLIIGDKSARSGWNYCLHRYCLRGVIAKPRAIDGISTSAQMTWVRRCWKSRQTPGCVHLRESDFPEAAFNQR